VYFTSHTHEITNLLVVGVLYMVQLIVPVHKDVLLVTNMRTYSLPYRPCVGYNYLIYPVILGWVYLEWARIPGCNCNNCCWQPRLYRLLQMGLYFFGWFLNLWSANSLESALDRQTKAVADYMKRESSKLSASSPFFDDDANSNSSLQLLDSCRYPFVQGRNGEWVTVKDLVQRDDLPNEDKDIWLSYSLCRLLARRYYGFHCTEGDDKVRRLALADLGTTDGYKRAFTITEVQLAFLHDYFFTASLPIIESGLKYVGAAQKLMLAFTIIISYFCVYTTTSISMFSISANPIAVATFMSWCALVFQTPMSLMVKNLLAFYWRLSHCFSQTRRSPQRPP